MQQLSLFDLNEFIRRVIALNFTGPVWITAEIAEASLSKGHLYLNLVQHSTGEITGDEGIVAQAQAILWQRDRRKIFMAHGQMAEMALSAGAQAKLLVRPDFHERYGLKLHIEDIDPAWSLGVMAMQRRQTIELLQKEGIWDDNRSLQLPAVLQRVAVITSPEAAGFMDFKAHLRENMYGYKFVATVFHAAVQGKNAVAEITAALHPIAENPERFDAVIIIRGGGARLDLSVFDDRDLCRAVAAMPLPVITGVGHEIDESVLDLIAHRALKTPTAVADFLVERNLYFESAILETAARMQQIAGLKVRHHTDLTEQLHQQMQRSAQRVLLSSKSNLDRISAEIPFLTRQRIVSEKQNLAHAEHLAAAFSPENILKRGYSLTLKNGKIVKSSSELSTGDIITTRLPDGTVQSRVEE